jgi:Phage integrase, N-terminal SAM-like domain
MTTTTTSAVLVPVVPLFTNTERLALAGFLAGYSGLTREAYELDLRQYAAWCHQHHVRLFQARRADIECFARDLESRGRARATITRRLCTIAGFYRYAVEEDLLDHSPAAHVRRPRLDESHATGLDRNELGAPARCCRTALVAVGLVQPHSRDLSTSTSQPGEDGSKPCSTSQRTASRLRNDHHARITSRSTSVP